MGDTSSLIGERWTAAKLCRETFSINVPNLYQRPVAQVDIAKSPDSPSTGFWGRFLDEFEVKEAWLLGRLPSWTRPLRFTILWPRTHRRIDQHC